MRIAINASILGDQPTGTNVYTRQVLAHLALLPEVRLHQIEVFTPKRLSLPDWVIQHELPENLGRSTHGRSNALRRFIWNQHTFARLAKGFDRIYCPTYNTSLGSANQTITVHDLIALRYPLQHVSQYAYCRLALPRLLRHARHIVAISEATRQDILALVPSVFGRITVIPNGHDSTTFSSTVQAQDARVLSRLGLAHYGLVIGATFPHKNLEVLLHAWRMSHTNLLLAIVGAPNSYLETIRHLAIKLGLRDSVLFLGYIPEDEIPTLYRNAAMLLYPSLCEGFGLPLLEAMSCRCPVIASNTSSLPEVAGSAASLCDPRNPASWAHAIQNLQNDQNAREALIQKGLERVKKFSWQKTAQEIWKLIQE